MRDLYLQVQGIGEMGIMLLITMDVVQACFWCCIYSISRHRTRDAKNDEVLADTFAAAAAAEAIDEASTVLWREDAKADDDDDQLKTGWQMDGVEVQKEVVEDADDEELMLQDEVDVAGVVGYKCISDCSNGVYNGVRGYEDV